MAELVNLTARTFYSLKHGVRNQAQSHLWADFRQSESILTRPQNQNPRPIRTICGTRPLHKKSSCDSTAQEEAEFCVGTAGLRDCGGLQSLTYRRWTFATR